MLSRGHFFTRAVLGAVLCAALLSGASTAHAGEQTSPEPDAAGAGAGDAEAHVDADAAANLFGLGPEDMLAHAVSGTWLDPQDPYWVPRRGQRVEIGVQLGGEGAGSALSTDELPTIGGAALTALARYYPVDRLAVVVGVRSYFGLDGIPAAGTTASTVASLLSGVRYDLVRENRFSLLWDLYSGPSLYVFADLGTSKPSDVAIGGEMGTGIALCYSVGPLTGEARGIVGGRAGASSSPFQRAGDAGPFSAVYAGIDLGLTWSMR